MYETGNQKDRDKKRIILRDPRCQRGGDAAHSIAQCAECTGCSNRICRAVLCHRTGCRTRGIILSRVANFTKIRCFHQIRIKKTNSSAPRGAAVFIVDSCVLTPPLFTARIYQSEKRPDIYSFSGFGHTADIQNALFGIPHLRPFPQGTERAEH